MGAGCCVLVCLLHQLQHTHVHAANFASLQLNFCFPQVLTKHANEQVYRPKKLRWSRWIPQGQTLKSCRLKRCSGPLPDWRMTRRCCHQTCTTACKSGKNRPPLTDLPGAGGGKRHLRTVSFCITSQQHLLDRPCRGPQQLEVG